MPDAGVRKMAGPSKALAWGVFLYLSVTGAGPLMAQLPTSGARSVSGQFIMVGAFPQGSLPGTLPPGEKKADRVELDSMLLPVSCERIKQSVLQELAAPSAGWEGKVLLSIRPAGWNDPGILIASERYLNTWQYRVELPSPVDRNQYVRAIVQVVLTEMANRRAATGAELPSWLVDGLARRILSSRQMEVILAPPGANPRGIAFSPAIVSQTQDNPLKAAHAVLQRSGAFSFDDLSWRTEGVLDTPEAERYLASAEVFVSGLERLPNGKACLRRMLEILPNHYNWQYAFLNAFSQYFHSALDVEKWWSLQTIHFTGRDISNFWSLQESRQKLKEALRVPVRVHRGTNSLPSADSLMLQQALREWDDTKLKPVLERKIRELELVRMRVAPELVELLDRYRSLLVDTLDMRSNAGLPFGIRKKAAQASIARKTAAQLDQLDALLAQAMEANKTSAWDQKDTQVIDTKQAARR